VASRLDGVGEGTNDLLVIGEVGSFLEVLGESFTSDGHTRAINETLLEQHLQQSRGTTNIEQVGHDVLAGRLQVGQEGDPVRDRLEVLNSELHANRIGNGDQVQNGVCGSTSDVDNNHGVLESLTGKDITGTNVLSEQLLDSTTSSQTLEVLGLRVGRVGGRARQGHTHSLNSGGHGVGSVHTTTGTLTRAGVTNDIETLRLGDLFGDELTVGLESGDDIDVGVVLSNSTSRLDGSTIDHQTGAVEATHGHQDTGHVLVTTGDRDVGIVPLTTHDSLDGIGNQVTTLQGVAHTRGTHTNGITDTNGVELEAYHVLILHTLANLIVQVEQMHIAWVTVEPDGRDTDLRLVHILLGETDGVQHGLRGTLGDGLGDVARHLVKGGILLIAGNSSGECATRNQLTIVSK